MIGRKTIAAVIFAALSASAAFAEWTPEKTDLCFYGTPSHINAAIRDGMLSAKETDDAGFTAFMYAAQNNTDPNSIRALLHAGADVNAKGGPNGSTALMLAAHACRSC